MNEFEKSEKKLKEALGVKINKFGALTFEFMENGRRTQHSPFGDHDFKTFVMEDFSKLVQFRQSVIVGKN